jgi:Divergent InlB B-repeat domain
MGFQASTPAAARVARPRVRWLMYAVLSVAIVALLAPAGALADGTVHVDYPDGPGMVTSDPPGISCPPTCDTTFADGTTVLLTGSPVSGYSFFDWGDGCSAFDFSTDPDGCIVNVTQPATTVEAIFHPSAKLDVSPQGPGSVQASVPNPVLGEGDAEFGGHGRSAGTGECHDDADSIGDAHCALPYLPGRVVTLTATPDDGAPFLGWGRYDCPVTSLTCVITMNSEQESVAPLFGQTAPLHVAIRGLGVVTSAPAGLFGSDPDTGLQCTTTADQPATECDATPSMLSEVRLTATPTDPSELVHWGSRCDVPVADPNTCLVTMGGTEWIAVGIGVPAPNDEFPPGYDIVFTVNHLGNGSVRGSHISCGSSCSAIYPFGDHDTLVASPDSGSHFVTWRGACGTNPTCSLWVGPTTSLQAVFDTDSQPPPSSPPTPAANPQSPPDSPQVTPSQAQPKPGAADTTKTGQVELAAWIAQFRVVRHRGTRVMVVHLFADHAAVSHVALVRGRTRASWLLNLRGGNQTVRLRVPGGTRAGHARLVFSLIDTAGNTKTLTRSLQLRS